MRTLAALLGLLAVALAGTTAASGTLRPNVKGTFVRAPGVASCYPGEPCDQPPQAAFLLFTRNGHSTRVRLGGSGGFAVRLAAGLYRVTVLPGHSASVSPATLRVPRVGVIHPRLVERKTSQPAPS
jgi:hypothetical protein